MQNLETDPSWGPDPLTEEYKPAWCVPMPQTGNQDEILDWLKLRKNHLKFRSTVLMKRQQLRTRLPDAGEQDEQINELAGISKELEDLTIKQRELGYYEEHEDLRHPPQSVLATEIPNISEEINLWPPPPPCVLVSNAKRLSNIPLMPVDLELGREPAVTQCPGCGEVVTTETVKKIGDAIWILCCMTSVLGCCLIPFCIGSLKDIHHACPKCHKEICQQPKI